MITKIVKLVLIFIFLVSCFVSIGVSALKRVEKQSYSESQVNGNIFDKKAEKFKENEKNDMIQVSSGGHILGFKPGEMYIAAPDHVLKIEYPRANRVKPVSDSKAEKGMGKASPLNKVSYKNLWDNVDLVYEKQDSGVYKSTYYIEPAKDKKTNPVDKIRLKYNVQVKIEKGGNLLFNFKTGQLRESKPIAWQIIERKKVPVKVKFIQISKKEIGFKVEQYNPGYKLIIDPTLTWNTFLGGVGNDAALGIALDSSGNIYVTGSSPATWGNPLNPFVGNSSAFVAKLNNNGVYLWHTFIGGANWEFGLAIALDSRGNIYVTGESSTWGNPLNPHSGVSDAFVVKLNNNGVYLWHTFFGGIFSDMGFDIALDSNGNIYVTGHSHGAWDSSVNFFGNYTDVFVTKLNKNGVYLWHTFLGGISYDYSPKITLDSIGNIYLTGISGSTWGSPVNPHSGVSDAFVAKLNNNGVYLWHTFIGGTSDDSSHDIALDSSGNIYITGFSENTWGNPLNPFAGNGDALVAKLNNNGVYLWHTFIGGSYYDSGYDLTLDSNGNIYVIGSSHSSWGTPLNPFAGSVYTTNSFIAKLNNSGVYLCHTFIGGTSGDFGDDIALDSKGNIYVAGGSGSTWGSPVNPHSGSYRDAFIAKLSFNSDIVLSKTVNDPSPTVGENVIYTIKVTNNGPIDALGLQVTDKLPAGISFVSSNPSQGSYTNETGLWNIGTLLNGSTISLKISARVNRTGSFNNTASVTALMNNDPVSSNNSDNAIITAYHTVTAQVSGGHGKVSPLSQNVHYGNNASISINPDIGYEIASISDNGMSQSLTNPYIIRNIRENHSIIVIFKLISYEIKAMVSDGHGKVSPSTQKVNYGNNASILISPDHGYEIASISDNGISKPLFNPYLINNVISDHNINITFKPMVSINLTGQKKIERAWIIKKYYGELNFSVIDPGSLANSFIIRRSKDQEGFIDISQISKSELSNSSYTYFDKYLEKNSSYKYKIMVHDSAGMILAESNIINL